MHTDSRHNRRMPSFVSELRRRNVLRVAAAYALVAWIFIEAGSVLLPTFGAPDWFFATVYVPVAFGGFIVAMIIAWVFEITPDGVKLERDVDRATYEPRKSNTMNRIIIALLVVALGISITFNITGMRGEAVGGNEEIAHGSIAVLPFESRSTDRENQYFADGIHDDILTRLAAIESLRVISRTSVNEYRNTNKNVRQIGEELGVTTVLEGAVQRAGNQVRISVQLIDARTDQPIWTDTFDRDYTLENIFELQTAISSQIASSLRAAMSPEAETRMADVPTNNTDAYVEYVKGMRNLSERSFASLVDARRQFERAIELDPGYAEARARLAETVLVTMTNHASIVPEEAYAIAGEHIARALELDPGLAVAHAANGLFEQSLWERDYVGPGNARAAAAFEEAIRLNPSLASAYVWFASLRSTEGDTESAIELLTKALEIDPLSRIPYVNLPSFLASQGQNDEATELLLEAIGIFPDWSTPYQYLSNHLQRLGRLDEAVAWGLKALSFSADPMAGGNLMPVYQDFGDDEAMTAFVENFPVDHPLYPIGKSYWHYILREYEETLAGLERVPDLSQFPAQIYLPLLVNASVLTKDYDDAYNYLVENTPSLNPDTELIVDHNNVRQAIMLSFIQDRRNRRNDALRLLDRAEPVVRKLPRLGMSGHGIRDVHILTLRGHRSAAIDALADAVEAGFVSSQAFDGWPFDEDPIIEPLRDDPRFQELAKRINERVEIMRRNAEEAATSGNWDALMAKADSA